MKAHRKRSASMWLPLCITHSWSTLREFIQIAHNMFWIVLKCVLAIVPSEAHVKYMREFFTDGAGGGGGRVVQGWIAGVCNTCYILPLQTLISVFISFLCNLFSFMVELTQVSRVQWFNTHVSFTCLVKFSKALPLSKMPVSLAFLTNKWRGFFWFLFITYISSPLSSSSNGRICLKNILGNILWKLDPCACIYIYISFFHINICQAMWKNLMML